MLTILLSLRTVLVSICLPMAVAITPPPAATAPARVVYVGAHKPAPAAVGDRILGRWYFPMRESDIEIYRENDHYFARIVAVGQATATKFGNMANKILLTDLTFAKNEWSGGQLIHPQTGSHFDVFLKLADANTLVITAYKGCRLFNKSYTLTRL